MKRIDVLKSKRRCPFDPEVFLETEDGGRTIFKYKKDHTLFVQGGPADAVFYIRNGKVKITVVSAQGKEAVVAILGPDEFCGESCLTGQVRRQATAAAMTECEIMRLEKATMIRILHEELAFSEMFVAHLLARTRRVEEDFGRSTVQFEREAPSTGPSLTGKFWQGRSTRAGHREGQPRDACGDDWYHSISRELLHEQISEIGPHYVVGYSRLMGIAEARTLGRLNALRHDLIDPAIAAHSGRIVKLMGDGALVEFASAVDAVTCAIEIQKQLRDHDAASAKGDPIRFRIEINVGDIIIEGDDILGDGVNIAARIEGIAEPGGISISEDAWRQVQGKVAADFVDAGEQSLKNIARPVRVYRLDLTQKTASASQAP